MSITGLRYLFVMVRYIPLSSLLRHVFISSHPFPSLPFPSLVFTIPIMMAPCIYTPVSFSLYSADTSSTQTASSLSHSPRSLLCHDDSSSLATLRACLPSVCVYDSAFALTLSVGASRSRSTNSKSPSFDPLLVRPKQSLSNFAFDVSCSASSPLIRCRFVAAVPPSTQ